jgi:hypothetical protein
MAEPTPPEQRHLSSVLGWATEALQEGENFLRSQIGADRTQETIANIMGDYSADVTQSALSDLVDNRLGKIASDLVAALTDIKPFWDYRTYNQRFDQQATMAGKLSTSWYMKNNIDLKFADVVRWNLPGGTGYAHQVYNEQIADIDLIAENPQDCFPIRPSSYISCQDAFGMMVRRERTVNYLRAKYPLAANRIQADRDASFIARARNKVQTVLAKLNMASSPFWDSIASKPTETINVPAADLFQIYVKDGAVNESGRPVWVGEGTPDQHPNWSYWVKPGDPIYPRGRNIVFTRTAVLRDGPNIYWHGMFPMSKLTLDPWPWSWLGKPLLHDAIPLQKELNRLMRGVSDHNQKVFRPDLVAENNSMPRSAMEAIDTRRAGLKLRTLPGRTATVAETKELDRAVAESIKDLRDEMDILAGTRDLTQMMKLGQIPTSETVEKIVESMSPSIRLRSRVLEAFIREFATMLLANFFQFYDTAKRLAVLGPDGITFEDFDYDPGTMLPDFINSDDEKSRVIRPRYERAREFLRQFTYHVAPGSLLAASEITTKLLYIQLARAGWMDIWTLLEKLGVPNVGNPPPEAKSITDRLKVQMNMGLGMAVSPAGRKASGQQMPSMTSQGGIQES